MSVTFVSGLNFMLMHPLVSPFLSVIYSVGKEIVSYDCS